MIKLWKLDIHAWDAKEKYFNTGEKTTVHPRGESPEFTELPELPESPELSEVPKYPTPTNSSNIIHNFLYNATWTYTNEDYEVQLILSGKSLQQNAKISV